MSAPAPPSEPGREAVSTAVEEVTEARPTLKELRLRGLLVAMAGINLLLGTFWAAGQGIFIALQLQRIDPANRVSNLGAVVGISAIVAMIAAPIAGTLSDQTRSRIGGRAPWILGGAAATVIFAVLLGTATSVAQIIIFWALVQVATNFISTPVSAHLPERVPVLRRGVFSAAIGLGVLVGSVIGQAAGAAFSGAILTGYLTLAGLVAAAAVAFVLVAKRSNIGEPRQPVNVRNILSTFWVSPVKYPNFALVFAGRFLLFIGFFSVQAYLLYVLQDYIRLGDGAVTAVPLVGVAGLAGMILSTPIAGWLTDRVGRSKVIIYITSAILAVGLLVPLLLPTLTGMLLYSFIAGLGFGAYQSVDYVLVTQVLPSTAEAGKGLGVINITTTLPQTIGVGVASLVVTGFGGFAALFPVASLAVIIGACVIVPVRNVR